MSVCDASEAKGPASVLLQNQWFFYQQTHEAENQVLRVGAPFALTDSSEQILGKQR